jgi:cell division protein FtsN
MNERVPDSSGLPLRAMVMVLLFLGVIFLLVGFQAMSSSNDGADDNSARTLTTTTSSKPAAPKPDVRIYSVTDDQAGATRVGERLREAGWNVTEATTSTVAQVPATTVYFGSAEGEKAAAEEVGKVLEAPVEARIPEIAEQPPGVIVLVAG